MKLASPVHVSIDCLTETEPQLLISICAVPHDTTCKHPQRPSDPSTLPVPAVGSKSTHSKTVKITNFAAKTQGTQTENEEKT